MGVARSALHYRSGKVQKDAAVLARMAELSAQYPRYGYRRIAIFLGRDGHRMSFGRAHRLWRRARLQVPRKCPRKRIATGRPRPSAPTGANQVWSYDFVFDWCANALPRPAITMAGHQSVPVQDAGDEIVVGDQHPLIARQSGREDSHFD
jgi:putative transposase